MITGNAFTERQADFDFCEAVIKRHSKSFYAAFSQLPFEKRQSVYAIYAFCRLADDIVDENQEEQELTDLFQQLTDFEAGHVPDEPMWRALAVVFAHYPMDIRPFYDMLVGQRKDLNFQQPQTEQELLDYAYYVAGSVGLMLLPILSETPEQIIHPAKKLGEAMQLTNILRDIGEDYAINRIYLPQNLMKKYGVTVDDLAQKKVSANFIALWEEIAQQAEKRYNEALEMIPFIDIEARPALLSAMFIYQELLPTIRKKQYRVFDKKHAVSTKRKLELVYAVKRNV